MSAFGLRPAAVYYANGDRSEGESDVVVWELDESVIRGPWAHNGPRALSVAGERWRSSAHRFLR